MLTDKISKRLQTTQAQLQEISYAQELNQETSYRCILVEWARGYFAL